MIEIKWKRCGQWHAYGDTHRECEIHTDEEMSDKEILARLGETGKMEESVFKNTEKTMEQYFRGYYTIKKTPYGYYYHGIEPYDD